MVVGGMKDCAMVIARDSTLAREKSGCWEWAGHIPGVCVLGGKVWAPGASIGLLSGGTTSPAGCWGVGYGVRLELLGFCGTGFGAGLMEPLRGAWLTIKGYG